MIPEAIDQITVHLISNDFLNEERFALHFTRGKFQIKKWGKIRLKYELQRRDISRYIIDKALADIDHDTYINSLDDLVEKKWQQLSEEKNFRKKRRKLLEYLQYRGWENHLIYERLKNL